VSKRSGSSVGFCRCHFLIDLIVALGINEPKEGSAASDVLRRGQPYLLWYFNL
jgi:hypothetical protein